MSFGNGHHKTCECGVCVAAKNDPYGKFDGNSTLCLGYSDVQKREQDWEQKHPADCELVSTAWLLTLKRELLVTKEKLKSAEDKVADYDWVVDKLAVAENQAREWKQVGAPNGFVARVAELEMALRACDMALSYAIGTHGNSCRDSNSCKAMAKFLSAAALVTKALYP